MQDSIPVLPVFIFDTEILDELPDRKDARVQFIYNQINNLYTRLNGVFLVRQGVPREVFDQILSKFSVNAVYANHDYEPYAIQRDGEISTLLKTKVKNFILLKTR